MSQGCQRVRAVTARTVGSEVLLMVSLLLAITIGCSSKEQSPAAQPSKSNNRPPTITSASILPTPVVLANPLTVRVDAQDPDGQNVMFRYRWLINGNIVEGQNGATLTPQLLKRGDQVAVEVIPSDGIADGAAFRTADTPVVNTPPVFQKASVEVDSSTGGRYLVAHAEVFDPDRDFFTLAYRWMKNESPIQEGDSNRLEIKGLSAQDTIQIEITASDGAPDGVSSRATSFKTVNSAPTIVSTPPPAVDTGRYAYLVQATDADGDPVSYVLEKAPPGMSIDAATGQMQWTVPPDLTGVHQIRVVAQDDRGGLGAQEFELTLVPPQPSPEQQAEKS